MVVSTNRNAKDHVLREGRERSDEHKAHVGAQVGKPALDRVIQARIGDKLRAMYGELSEQPVPDRLVALLDRLGKD